MKHPFFFLILLIVTPACSTAQVREDKTLTSKIAEQFEVMVEVYRPKSSASPKSRTVIILPPTGGATRLERSYAKGIAETGATAVVVKTWTGLGESSLDLEIHQVLHERAMTAIRTLINHTPNDHRISVMGTSVGGIFVSVAASLFHRPDTFLVIAGGAPIPEVIAFSDQSALADVREKRKERFGFQSTEEYAAALDKVFELDPFKHPLPDKKKKLGIVVLKKDTTVLTSYQEQLRDHWGDPYTIEINAGHTFGIFRTWWAYYDEVIDFVAP